MKIKNKRKFERRFNEFLTVYENGTTFTGKQSPTVIFNDEGVSALESFYSYETYGTLLETKEVEILTKVLIGKTALDLTIKQWAEGLNDFSPFVWELKNWIRECNFPDWTVKAVINLHNKIYNRSLSLE